MREGSILPENPPIFVLLVHYMGYLYDDVSLALLYAAADVMGLLRDRITCRIRLWNHWPAAHLL